MISLIIRVMIVILANKACFVGQPVDYYPFMATHQNYSVIWSTEGQIWGDYWLMRFDDGETMLFKFKQPISETVGSGASHGACARLVK